MTRLESFALQPTSSSTISRAATRLSKLRVVRSPNTPAQRRTAGGLDPDASSFTNWIDRLHVLMLIYGRRPARGTKQLARTGMGEGLSLRRSPASCASRDPSREGQGAVCAPRAGFLTFVPPCSTRFRCQLIRPPTSAERSIRDRGRACVQRSWSTRTRREEAAEGER